MDSAIVDTAMRPLTRLAFCWLLTAAVAACARVDAGSGSPPAVADVRPTESLTAGSPPAESRTVSREVKAVEDSPARARDFVKAREALGLGIRTLRGPRKVGKATERAEVGFFARSLDTNETLYGASQDQLLSAASNTKLFTTAAALVRLGANYRFETLFSSDGAIRDGVLEGDLWIIGGGDPTLTQENDWCPGGADGVLSRVALELTKQGIRKIGGSLVVDDRLFAGERYHSGWPARDRGKAHAIDVSALCVEHHRIQLVADGTGPEVRIHAIPRFRGIRVESSVKAVKGGNTGIVAHVDGESIRVSGTVPIGGSESTSIFWLDGPRLFGNVALEAFAMANVEVERGLRVPAVGEAAPRRTLVQLNSAVPLTDVIRVTNQESDNLYAEMILKLLGAKFRGQGSFADGVDVVRETLESMGVATAGYAAVDGSGLARDSRASAATLVSLLEAMARGPYKATYRDSLALGGGRDGTLRKRFREALFAGRVRAKTGSLDSVSSLSGYAEAVTGETFAFSILVNFERGGSSKADEEQLVRRIVEIDGR